MSDVLPPDAKARDRKACLSCAECRRSKLKCDRVFPCQSCLRRGCASICPNGTLAATKGNKVLMAHADRLSEEVKALTTRIRQLEAALKSQAEESNPSPLNSTETPHSARNTPCCEVSCALGSLSIGGEGQTKYYGETAGSEYLRELLPVDDDDDGHVRDFKAYSFPKEIVELFRAFPLGLDHGSYSKHMFLPFLPSKKRALELVDLYYEHATWMYDPFTRGDFMSTIMEPMYGDSGIINLKAIHSHRLSAFFILIAHGALNESRPGESCSAKQYHSLSKAALSLDPVQQDASCATVQAIFMHVRFLYDFDRHSIEERWLLVGLCSRIAQRIGLQRDCAGWNLSPDEVQRRRIVFWELFTWDTWGSLVTGRPPSLSIHHTDCRFADEVEPQHDSAELSYHAWKWRYTASCLTASVSHVFSIVSPGYQALLDIDKLILQMPLPSHLQSPIGSAAGRSWSALPNVALQQYFVMCLTESTLLYAHRSYFAQAIRERPDNPLRHKFAHSVSTIYRSASRIITGLQSVYSMHPARISESNTWFYWSAIFSSCVVLGALVIDSPGCTLVPDALKHLEEAIILYEEGSKTVRPPTTLNTLQKLHQRANASFFAFKAGLKENKSQAPHRPEAPDELAVLGGRNSVIQKRSASGLPPSPASPSLLNFDDNINNNSATITHYRLSSNGEPPAVQGAQFLSNAYATSVSHEAFGHTSPTLAGDFVIDSCTTIGERIAPVIGDPLVDSQTPMTEFVPNDHLHLGGSDHWFARADSHFFFHQAASRDGEHHQLPQFNPEVLAPEYDRVSHPIDFVAGQDMVCQSTSPHGSWKQFMAGFGI